MAAVEPALRVETADAPGSWLLGEPVVLFEDAIFRGVSMMITDEGVSAAAAVQLSLLDEPPLDQFLAGLADSWRGWPGTRVWRALERQLELDARHDGRGHVTLGVTLKSRRYARRVEDWSARTCLSIEAGEQMQRLAQDVTSLLGW
jgi:Family of unknown function (DUF6228)